MDLLPKKLLRWMRREIDKEIAKRIETAAEPRMYAVEQKVRFLVAENVRLNQVIRELIYRNDLSRAVTGVQTKGSFDYQWREVPAGEAMPSNPEFMKTVPDLILQRTRLPREWFAGKRVLDAGCGSGRWTYGLAKLGAKVTAVDQSEGGLAAVRELVRGVGDVELKQVDLLREETLPAGPFDLVWCFGVAHHTENMIRAIVNLMPRVAPGGWMFMMLYGTPETIGAFTTHASYEEWRRKLLPLSFPEKVEELKKAFPPEQVHGWFDAVSPAINELVTWEWIQGWFKENGFDSLARTVDHPNHHFIARKVDRAAAATE